MNFCCLCNHRYRLLKYFKNRYAKGCENVRAGKKPMTNDPGSVSKQSETGGMSIKTWLIVCQYGMTLASHLRVTGAGDTCSSQEPKVTLHADWKLMRQIRQKKLSTSVLTAMYAGNRRTWKACCSPVELFLLSPSFFSHQKQCDKKRGTDSVGHGFLHAFRGGGRRFGSFEV